VAKEFVLLVGGPDNGVELAYDVPPPLPDTIHYSGSVYDNAHKTRDDGSGLTVHVFEYDAVKSGEAISVPHAHKGWHDLRHSVNVKLPAALKDSQKLGEHSLRALARARRVLK